MSIWHDTDNKQTHKGREKNSSTAIDHILADCIADCQFTTAILKTDVTDHFPIAMALRTDESVHQSRKVSTMKRSLHHLKNDCEKLTG